MFDSLIGNASFLEMFWTFNSIIGGFLSVRNWRSAFADYTIIGGITNGRRMIAVSTLIIETIILAKFALYLIIGIIALALPQAPPNQGTPVAVIIGFILVLATVGLTAISAINRRTSDYLIRYGMQTRDASGKFIKETQNQQEDRKFGEERRKLEDEHNG